MEGLTRENVASHLQKYRLQLRKAAAASGGSEVRDGSTSPPGGHTSHDSQHPSETAGQSHGSGVELSAVTVARHASGHSGGHSGAGGQSAWQSSGTGCSPQDPTQSKGSSRLGSNRASGDHSIVQLGAHGSMEYSARLSAGHSAGLSAGQGVNHGAVPGEEFLATHAAGDFEMLRGLAFPAFPATQLLASPTVSQLMMQSPTAGQFSTGARSYSWEQGWPPGGSPNL